MFAILALIAVWRLDEAVRTAYSSGWTADIIKQTGCSRCRLPDEAWIWTHLGLSGLWVALIVIAVRPLRTLKWTFTVFASLAVAAEVGAILCRGFADYGGHGRADHWAAGLDFAVLALVGVFLVIELSPPGAVGAVGKLRLLFQRYRINAIALALLVVLVDLITDTSSQAIDSVRTWMVPDRTHLSHLGFGLAATIGLALVVYETSLRLANKHAGVTAPPVKPAIPARTVGWWVATVAVIALGAVLRFALPFGFGILVLGGLMAALGFLELPHVGVAPSSNASSPQPTVGLAPELLAIVPLLTIASAAIAGGIDSMLSDAPNVHPSSYGLFFPAAFLGLVAVLMTRVSGSAPAPALPTWAGWGVALVVVVILSSPLWVSSELWAAVIGFVFLVAVLVYAGLLFHAPQRVSRNGFIILPVSLLGALTTLVALHIRVIGVGRTLGVFGLVDIALAGTLAALFWIAHWNIVRRPPDLLARVGFQQLPILTILFAWWIVSGILAPAQLHDARITQRATGSTAAPTTLARAFHQWVHVQAPILGKPGNGPVPLLLVATHGGGIRSAYWTAIALDCIVGATAKPEKLKEPNYDQTCTAQRRTRAQAAAAARDIFLISSVSGGAVGTYAYARELLAEGALPSGWVTAKLGNDFASPTIGWGLFHDLPNHLVGLHPGTGGTCGIASRDGCVAADRATVLENSLDKQWTPPPPTLRGIWDARASADARNASLVPLLIFNSTVVGGISRAVTSTVALSDWPLPESSALSRTNAIDGRPLAGTPQVLAALCAGNDLRLSTAALLAGRFPYISPAARIDEKCRPYADPGSKRNGPCAVKERDVGQAGCKLELVDGGYIDNSGLATVDALFPTIKQLVEAQNAKPAMKRKIALVIVELDNYYRAAPSEAPSADSTVGQTFAPPATAFGGRNSVETFARADAYRLTPFGCTITVSPAQHPGLHAPVGWEISPGAQTELRNGLVAYRYTDERAVQPLFLIKRLQTWLGGKNVLRLGHCVPHD